MCLWLKGRELNYKCQYFDSDYLRVFLGYFFDWGGWEGGIFKLNKQDFRFMEESTCVF